MALPICMLPKIQISWGRKVGLGFVFSIAIVTVALDIVRTVESIGGGAFGYISLYCILETTFTVIISCLPVYPSMVGYLRKERDSRAAAKTSRFNSDGATLVNVTPMGKSKGGSGTDSVGGRSLDFGDEYHDGLALYAHKKTSSEPATRARFEGYDRMSSKESHDTQRANDVV
ncbi:hypothetical protein MMC25_001450 [Agyrium rufum]|nr:hypothetical protein [Agyrium rufum]